MATFTLSKGNSFNIGKGISNILVGLGWDVSGNSSGKQFDVDAHAFGCVVNGQGVPSFYNGGSHAVTYANGDLKKGAGKSFGTQDDSIIHTGDNRSGIGEGDDEQIIISLDKVPAEINEISIFITIHEAKQRGQNFGQVKNSFIHVIDQDSKEELCRYNLEQEFNDAISIQVGSLVHENNVWTFKAVGGGTASEGLGEILGKLS